MKSDLSPKVKGQLKALLEGFPITGNYLLRRYLKKHSKVEMELIEGKYQNYSNHPSVIHFSVNKAATQYVRELLSRCAAENGMTPVGLAEYAFHTKFPYLDQLSDREMVQYQYLFNPVGYLYSVFGGMVEGIPELEKYRVILMIRDPRDVLVSEYYSYAFSHSEPSRLGDKYADFMRMRQKARTITIDEYVVSECDRVCVNYERYVSLLLDRYAHVLVTKYEEMTSDFEAWLKKILEHCEFKISDRLLESILNEAGHLKPKQEDIHQHIRKGMPGDYKEKLDRKTIDCIDAKFSSMLERFDYK